MPTIEVYVKDNNRTGRETSKEVSKTRERERRDTSVYKILTVFMNNIYVYRERVDISKHFMTEKVNLFHL